MICASCGTPLLSGAKFCGECGTPVATGCRSCGSELATGVKFCPECGTPTADAAGAPAGSGHTAGSPVAERRVTSVLFGDLVGFTTLSESRDPEEVRELLGRYFDTARDIVARYGGTIEKFIGDAVMAVWGVPTAHEDDAERAVRAGIDLTEAVAAFGESVGAPGLAMRVGVVTGEVAVSVGATGQGMVAGDAVNTAARVQAKADPGTVWVDAQTRALSGGSIDFREAGVHELKGKAEPIALFAATAVMGGVGGDRSSDRVQAPLVGRRRELSMVKEMFHVAAEEHRPRLVIVSGDAGIGKTRLSWELQNYIDGLSATVLWHRGRCLAYGDGVGFSALASAVRGRIGAGEDEDESTTRAKLAGALETYVPDTAERTWLTPAMAGLLGLPGPSTMTREDLFSAWLIWFERLTQQQGEPLIWVVDDAHHADEGLLDFIEHLATVAQASIMIVLLTRPELLARRPGLAALRRANLIGLETLSRGDIGALFDGLVEGLPTDVRDALVNRAEGNPLFAIETVRAMNDQGLTVGGPTRRAGAVRLATGVDAERLSALASPASLHVLVASRLDLLPARERTLLAAASVLGQTFGRGALEAISDLPADDLAAALRELIGRDLLTTVTDRLSSEEGQYAFVQAVVRTVAYETQSKRDRLTRHLAVVDHLEASADSDGSVSAVIAQHLRDALSVSMPEDPHRVELATRLGSWLERSAGRSLAMGAPSDAMRAYVEAKSFAARPDDVVRLQLAAAEAALAAGVHAEAIEYALPIANGELPAGRTEQVSAVIVAGTAMRFADRSAEGTPLMAPYLDDARLDELPLLLGAKLARQASVYRADMAQWHDSWLWNERALRLAEDAGDPREIAHGLNDAALGYMARGLSRIGEALIDAAARFCRENRLGSELGRTLVNKLAFGFNRDLEPALEAGYEAMSVSEQTGDTNLCWHTAINLAIALTIAGRWDEPREVLDRPLLRERQPSHWQGSAIAFQSAVIAFARGDALDLDELDVHAAESETGEPEAINWLYAVADRTAHARGTGDTDVLVKSCRRLVDLIVKFVPLDDDFPHLWSWALDCMIHAKDFTTARDLLKPVSEASLHRLVPLLAAQLPRLQGTIEALDPASTAEPADVEGALLRGITLLDQFGAVPDRAQAQATLGLWLTRQGRPAEAAPHLAAARQTFADLRATAWLREVDAAESVSAAAG